MLPLESSGYFTISGCKTLTFVSFGLTEIVLLVLFRVTFQVYTSELYDVFFWIESIGDSWGSKKYSNKLWGRHPGKVFPRWNSEIPNVFKTTVPDDSWERSKCLSLVDVLWLVEAPGKLFRWFFVRMRFLGCVHRYLVKSLVFNGTIFE